LRRGEERRNGREAVEREEVIGEEEEDAEKRGRGKLWKRGRVRKES
jgi:hypothetical protein